MSDGLFTVIPNTRRAIKASPEEISRFRTSRAQKKAWNEANPEKVRESRRKQRPNISAWKKQNEDAVAEHRDRENTDKYHRPFVAIDSEGMDFEGEDTVVDGVTYKKHCPILWGAKGWKRKYSASALEKDPSLSRIEGEDTPAYWLGTPDKKALTSLEILDWLTSLPEKFSAANGYPNGVIFVSFAFGYNSTQILTNIPYHKGRQIANRKEPGQARLSSRYIFYKKFAIKYTKGKSIEIKRLRDERDPWKYTLEKDGSVTQEIDYDAYICVYDVFGFFQTSSFVRVSLLRVRHNGRMQSGTDASCFERPVCHRLFYDRWYC